MVPSGIRYFFGVKKSSVRNQPLKSALEAAGLNNSILSVGGGTSVRLSASLINTGTIAEGAGSELPGEPNTWLLGRQLLFEFQSSGWACSSTTTSENPRPSVI